MITPRLVSGSHHDVHVSTRMTDPLSIFRWLRTILSICIRYNGDGTTISGNWHNDVMSPEYESRRTHKANSRSIDRVKPLGLYNVYTWCTTTWIQRTLLLCRGLILYRSAIEYSVMVRVNEISTWLYDPVGDDHNANSATENRDVWYIPRVDVDSTYHSIV